MKERPNITGVILWATLLGFLIAAVGIAAFAAELRDYTLPSQKKYEVRFESRTPGATEPLESTSPASVQSSKQPKGYSVYDQFREEVKSLLPQQRKELKESLEKKRGAAVPGEEKAYYQQLIVIVDECGKK